MAAWLLVCQLRLWEKTCDSLLAHHLYHTRKECCFSCADLIMSRVPRSYTTSLLKTFLRLREGPVIPQVVCEI
ncbi:hypothetical protein B5F33_09095 [Collinsella sp. An2]|nr:hypothetical protein B5F33_09095 [Collinsella sp. An2]